MLKTTFRSQTSGVREWRGLGWLRSAERVLFSRPTGAGAAVLTTLIILGCMSTNQFQHSDEAPPAPVVREPSGGALEQNGKIPYKSGVVEVIYYPIPYASPPNLELDHVHTFDLLEQKENYFRIQWHTGEFFTSVHWKARGMPIPPPAAPPTETATLKPPAVAKVSGPDGPPPPPVPYVPETK